MTTLADHSLAQAQEEARDRIEADLHSGHPDPAYLEDVLNEIDRVLGIGDKRTRLDAIAACDLRGVLILVAERRARKLADAGLLDERARELATESDN